MGFGVFKKLKDKIKKGAAWLNTALKKVQPIAKQILNETPKVIKNEKVKNIFSAANDIYDITSDGINAVDEAVNKNNYSDVIDWTKANIAPRLKKH